MNGWKQTTSNRTKPSVRDKMKKKMQLWDQSKIIPSKYQIKPFKPEHPKLYSTTLQQDIGQAV